jgi:hypothetical protein
MVRILTLYLAKDFVNQECYESILKQESVDQDLVVVSAKKIDVASNFVAEVPREYPLPVRVGLSINRALAVHWNMRKYDYLFKVDNDVALPSDYLLDLVSRKRAIIGPGCAMLIEARFFERHFGSRWALSYCDDMYMKAYAFAKGFTEQIWEKDLKPMSAEYNPPNSREYEYGKEFYKFGDPFWLMCLRLLASIRNTFKRRKDRISITGSIYAIAGYVSELGTRKYEWHENYTKKLTRTYHHRLLSRAVGLAEGS